MERGVPRGELRESFRLLFTEERWLFAALLGGPVGYLIWVAGTGAAVDEFLDALAVLVALDRGSTELWVFALVWVVVPSLVAVRHVIGHVTNLRGNVEKHYRVDRPSVLLGPPAVLVVVAVVFGLANGSVTPAVLVAVGAANVVLLVRTVAYGYRVYSLSVPRLLQALLLVAAVATSLGLVCRFAPTAGKAALVEDALVRYGLGGTVSLGRSSVSPVALAGASAPGLVALSYLSAQTVASLVVRVRGPDVPRSAVRAGQRYPRVVQPGTDGGLWMEPAPEEAAGIDDDGDGDGTGSDDGADPGVASAGAAGTDGGPDADRDAESHRFGQTRVYTPPEKEDLPGTERCPICKETYAAAADHTHCPNCNAVIETE